MLVNVLPPWEATSVVWELAAATTESFMMSTWTLKQCSFVESARNRLVKPQRRSYENYFSA